jgi:hypothetical protein
MGRILAALLASLVLAGPASAAEPIVVGTGTTAWGRPFTLSVSTQKPAGRTMRCLDFAEGPSGGGGCPLTRPALDTVDTQASVDCRHKRVSLYGALDARVARVVVRLVGGRVLEATRFDPVAAVDPRMAFWAATFTGATAVRSVTTVAADGSVLARDRHALLSSCAEEREFSGRRYPVGFVNTDGQTWRLDAFRGLIHDAGEGLVRTLCFSLERVPSGGGLNIGGSATCGVTLTPEAKALAINADDVGCEADVNLILYGVARARVARIVFRSRSGWTAAIPKAAPRRLHAGGKLWLAAIHMPASGVVIDAQDARGRTIAKERLKPDRIPGVTGCAVSGGFGTL